MDGQKKKSQKKRSVIPVYAIGAVWLLYAGKLNTFRGIVSCAVVSAIVYGILRIVLRGKKTDTPEEAPAAAPEPQPAKPEPQPQPEADKLPPELQSVIYQGKTSIAKIRQLNDEIPDFKLSAQIKQIEILTDKILSHVRDNPEKLGEIKQFMSYYLPTTIKLLEQYVVLQNQGMRMGNIDDGMKRIEDMLDKVIVAFQKQLDSLFEADVVDITADIQVMEQMMASQGLTDRKDF